MVYKVGLGCEFFPFLDDVVVSEDCEYCHAPDERGRLQCSKRDKEFFDCTARTVVVIDWDDFIRIRNNAYRNVQRELEEKGLKDGMEMLNNFDYLKDARNHLSELQKERWDKLREKEKEVK